METFIKSEPIDYDDKDYPNNSEQNLNTTSNKRSISFIESLYESEQVYINNINSVFTMKCDDEFKNLSEFMIPNEEIDKSVLPNHIFNFDNGSIKIMSSANEINKQKEREVNKDNNRQTNKLKSSSYDSKVQMNKFQHQIATEKKRILTSLLEISKEKNTLNLSESNNNNEPFSKTFETKIYFKLDHQFNSNQSCSSELRRFKCKLELRRLKRKKHIKLFDIDSYVNELIDREKIFNSSNIKKDHSTEKNQSYSANLNHKDEKDEKFYFETLHKVNDNTGCEIIAVKRVLDRFKSGKNNMYNDCSFNYKTLSHMPIGIVQFRNDDVKCIFSPFTNKVLKPYIRRDYESLTAKLMLNLQIKEVKNCLNQNKSDRYSIDYVHLRPEHVIPINIMCEQHFWSGIDISECLNYPDYTMIALYRKLIVGFAFLVPNVTHNESYLSFIFVHPDWRNFIATNKNNNANSSISIAQYMLFYLIQINKDYEISLHVSVNSPAVLFYQKFGFNIEELIENFYDKYYSDMQNLSKDAFIMRLTQS